MYIENEVLSYYLGEKKGIFYFPNMFIDQIKAGKFDNNYYKKKYKLLIDNGVFEKKDILLEGNYSASVIKRAFANTMAIDFELTEKCNLNCDYCIFGNFYKQIPDRKNKSLNLNYAINLIDFSFDLFNDPSQNFSLGKPIYIGFYGGEPLLEFNKMIEIINYAESKVLRYNHLRYSMTTNATILGKYIDYFSREKFSDKWDCYGAETEKF